jgi:hypothetical protein
MNPPSLLDARARAVLRTQFTLWGAISAAVPMFAVMSVVVRPADPAPPQPLLPPLFGASSIGLVALSFILPRAQLATWLAKLNLPTREVAGDSASILPEAARPKVRVFVDPAGALLRALQISQPSLVLSLALREAIAMFGLVLVFSGFPPWIGAPFFVVSLVTLLLGAPSAARVARALEAATGAKLRA